MEESRCAGTQLVMVCHAVAHQRRLRAVPQARDVDRDEGRRAWASGVGGRRDHVDPRLG